MDFVGCYMELKTASNGAIRYCPLDENKVLRSSVNRIGNYWHCFAGCCGGSIIDFYMKLKDVEFGRAVHDLKDLLEVE